MNMSAKRHKTGVRGIYFVEESDSTRSYISRWQEERPLDVTRPWSIKRRTVEKRAATFEEACRLQAEGEAGSEQQRPSRSMMERFMAAKWFEYWVRR